MTPVETHPLRWFCGKQTPLYPTESDDLSHITLESVSIALAYQNRFLGMWGPASLAAHSLRVANRLDGPELKLAGLFHDIGEIMTGDISKPFKPLVSALVDIEIYWTHKLCLHLLGDELGSLVNNLVYDRRVKAADQADYFEMLEEQEWQFAYLKKRHSELSLIYSWYLTEHRERSPMIDAVKWVKVVERLMEDIHTFGIAEVTR